MRIVYDDVIREFSGIEYCGEPRGLCFVRTEQGYTYEGYVEYDYIERLQRKGRYKGMKHKKNERRIIWKK